jgi:carboxyl-terminal processing protease
MKKSEFVTPLELVSEALEIIEKNALERSAIQWSEQKPQWLKESATFSTLEEAHKLIRSVLKNLGDNHSFHLPSAPTLAETTSNSQHPVPTGFMFGERVGVIDIPGHGGDGKLGDGRDYARVVQDILYDLEQQGATAWVIDLRNNSGGDMWPMLAGLAPLLDRGTLGAFVNPQENWRNVWHYDGEKLWIDNHVKLEAKTKPLQNLAAPIALLTSGRTLSSGEAVLISFLGRLNTCTFGEPTGGLPTANAPYQLIDMSWLVLTVAFEADRIGRIYKTSIEPDVFVTIDWSKLNQEDDPVLLEASKWLQTIL